MKKKGITLKDVAVKVGELATTVESLAAITKRGFDRVDERFEKLEKKMDGEFEEVKDRLIKIENGHIGRIQRLEDDMRIVKTKVGVK